MRKFLLLALIAACELQPGPPRQTAPTPPAPTSPAPAPPAPTPPAPTNPTPTERPANVAPTNPKVPIEITRPCLDVATHVAGVIISSAEPAQRSIFEAERDRIVRSTGEVCTMQRWSEPAIACYKAATAQPGIKACETKFPTQPVQRQQPTAPADTQPVTNGGRRPEPGTPSAGSASPTLPGAGSAAVRPTPRPAAGAGSAAPRPGPGGLMPPRAGSGAR